MLNSFVKTFDCSGFERKLKHYFSDTAPIYADVELRLKEVRVFSGGKPCVLVPVDDNDSVKENVGRVIRYCERFLYPRMLAVAEQPVSLPDSRVKEMLFQGFSLGQIREKRVKKIWKLFIITRFNTAKNSIDYKEESTGKVFRAHFCRPLAACRGSILRLSEGGQDGMRELYRFVTENSRVEEIGEKDA
ncbi:MAG: hypothetical protein LBK66_03150 [Spirochaetaceae bacterium]|jgi:hypothetical protein|nr:hypothetical protein [Spirochaetaceae bacterium]